MLIHTDMPESSIAPYLTELHERVKKEGIRVGSYPQLYSESEWYVRCVLKVRELILV